MNFAPDASCRVHFSVHTESNDQCGPGSFPNAIYARSFGPSDLFTLTGPDSRGIAGAGYGTAQGP